MGIVLYTTNCPQCMMLEGALKNKGVSFETVYGEEEILKRGYQSAPILECNGKTMSFAEAVRWVNAIGGDSYAN